MIGAGGSTTMGSCRDGSQLSTATVAPDTWCQIGSVFDGTNNTVYLNGAAQTPESSFGSFGSTGTIVIGNNTGVGNSMTADIAEVVFWTSEATLAADISNLITYFTNKWF
jgi:Concanavalin A-like lectin/glucanases superfamily